MPIDPPFVPDRFRSTVPFYVKHRLGYPTLLLDEVVRRVGLGREDGILDLGCGPGTLAIALARAGFRHVTAMDPDPAMLAAARDEADRAGVPVRFIEGSSYDLDPASGPYRLVIMGRSFHWMDRAATLATLEVIVELGGAVVAVAETPERAPENRWKQVLAKVRRSGGAMGGVCRRRDRRRRRARLGRADPGQDGVLDRRCRDMSIWGSRPILSASIAWRRTSAAGWLPPHLACQFTVSDVSVLSVVATEMVWRGSSLSRPTACHRIRVSCWQSDGLSNRALWAMHRAWR